MRNRAMFLDGDGGPARANGVDMSKTTNTTLETIATSQLASTNGGIAGRWLANHPYAAQAFFDHHPNQAARFASNHPYAWGRIQSV